MVPVGRPASSVRVMDLDGEVSLFDERTGSAVALNRTASELWSLVPTADDLDEIVTTLADRYALRPEDIRDDVSAAHDELVRHGLLDLDTP